MMSESKENRIQALKDLINSNPDPRELKRALAVKLALEDYTYRAIQEILGVSYGFISKWKTNFLVWGIPGLRLAHKGRQGLLTQEQIKEVMDWLLSQEHWDKSELEVHLIVQYDVVFKSPQSYYELLNKARITWQKGEQINPRKNPELVKKRTEEIADLLESRREEIEAGSLVVYAIDECHLLWNDLCGYLWNRIKNAIKVPLLNPKERQTYYGALNLTSSEFVLSAYPAGNGECTVDFVKNLLNHKSDRKTFTNLGWS